MERNMLAKEISNLFMEQELSSLGIFTNPLEFTKRTIQAKITQLALQEWELWDRGKLEEDSKEALPLLTKYWKEGSDLSDSKAERFARNYKVQHWSAAFVCYIMKNIYPPFPSSPNHMEYYQWALTNTKNKGSEPFFVFKPHDAVIEVGDILLNARSGGSHGDIVIKVGDGKAEVIGGNVGNRTSGDSGVTVNIKTRKLNGKNKLENPNKKIFAVLKLLPGKVGNTTIASNPTSSQNREPVGKNHATSVPLSPWQILPAAVRANRNGSNSGVGVKITTEHLQELGGGKQNVQKLHDIVECINTYSLRFGVNTNLRMAHFIGQLSVETSNFKKTEETFNYSSKRLMEVFPRYFKSIASTLPYLGNPEAIANLVYGSRPNFDNDAPGDGFRFRGRGFIQVTGKYNYKKFTQWYNEQGLSGAKINFVKTPELVKDLPYSMISSFWFFDKHGLNKLADSNNIHEISKRINGNGYMRSFENRRLRTNLAKKILGVI